MRKHSKLLYLFLVVALVLNLVLPTSMAIASGEPEGSLNTIENTGTQDASGDLAQISLTSAVGPEITDKLITGVKIYDAKPIYDADGTIIPQGKEIETVRPKVKDTVAIIYNWSLPDGHPYGGGSTYTFSLPAEFKIPNELKGKLTGDVGDYVVATNGQVTFTFNDTIIAGQQLDGDFYVWLSFDESKLNGSLEQPIDFSAVGQGIINVHFANTAVDKLKKTGTANKNKINSDEIEWIVEFNQGEKEIKNAELNDTFPDGLALKGDITVQPLEIQLNGSVKAKGASTTASSFPISLGDIHGAYRVTYTTSVTAPTTAPFINREFANSAVLTSDGVISETDIGKVTVNFNEPLSKPNPQDSDYDAKTQTITWKIQYNYNEQSISQANAWIEDTFDPANKTKQALVDGKVNVYQVDINSAGKSTNPTLVDPSKYTLQSIGPGFEGGFKFQFNQAITKAYEIEYQTQAQARIYKDEAVANTVKMYDDTTKTGSKGIREVIFDKSVSKSDFQNKTIEWKLVLNQDLKAMTDVVIKDNYAGKHMKLDPNSIKVNGDNLVDSVFELDANAGDTGYTSGFILKLKNPSQAINTKYVITYTTSFDPTVGMPTNNEYKNEGTLDWNEAGIAQTSITKSAVVVPQNYTIENGNKIGEYNAKDKTITWKIDVNYNLYDIKNAVIKDSYTGNQTYVDNSLVVNELILKGDNNVTDIGNEVPLTNGQFTLNPDGKGFVLNLGNIGKTSYRITYKTSLDGEYPVVGDYSNHATLQDGTTNRFEKSVTVTPKHGGVYVNKTGKQEGQTDIASWTVNINPSQSYVAAGSILTDTLSDNQILLKDSLKLYKTDLPKDNSGKVSTKDGLVDKADYGLVVTGNTFTLTFKNALYTAYILEYQSFINADSGQRITNKAEFAGQSSSVKGEGNKEGVLVSLAGAGGGASTGSGKIKIVKVDDLNHPLQGVKFELYNASGTTLLETLVTDVKGEAITTRDYRYNDKTTGLPYKLKEVSVPTGYLIDPAYGAATGKTINFKDPNEPFKIVNKILRQGFELTKVDAADSSNKLQGAVFELKRNGTLIDTLTTGVDGKIAKGDLAPGDYELVEITAPDYYVVDAKPIKVKIDANQTEVLLLNQKNVLGTGGKLVITKINAKDHSAIQGVEFELRDSTKALIGTKTTDINGQIEFTNLAYGSYTLVETKADGYVIEQAETEVPIKQPDTALTIENKENDRSVQLTKYNSLKSQKLQGAVFELREETKIFDANGNYVYKLVPGIDKAKLTTNANGQLFLADLTPNKYQLVEIQAPFGYLLDKTPVAFEITDKQTETVWVEKTNNKVSIPVDPSGPSTGPGNPGTPPVNPTPVPPTPVPPTPVTPVEPTPVKPVEPTPVIPVVPTPVKPVSPNEKVETPKGTPVKGKIDLPKDNVPTISKGPKNGKVTIDPKGNWVYTPKKDYVGKDSFTIIIKDQKGNEKEVLVDVDVNDIPRGGTNGVSGKPGATNSKSGETLPKTGEFSHLPLQLTGISFIILGAALLLLRRKHLQNK